MTSFGVLGGFAGDDLLLARVSQLAERLRGPRSADVELSAVIDALESLPFAGRVELVLGAICEGPARDHWLRALFDACFVRPAAGGLGALGGDGQRYLDPRRSSILRLVVLAVPKCGRLGVELFEAYRRTTSTVMFGPFIEVLVASTVLTDDELEAVFVGAVDASRSAILDHCIAHAHRERFIGRLVAKKYVGTALIACADPESIEALLSSGAPADIATFEALGFSRWAQLSAVYLAHFRRRLGAKAHDPIGAGAVFRELEAHARALRPADVVELFRLCDELRPLEIAASVAPGVRAFLEGRSRAGALRGAYEGVAQVLPCERLVRVLRPEDQVALLRSCVDVTPRGWAFVETHEAVCERVLATVPRRESAKAQLFEVARAALDAVSADVVWAARMDGAPEPALRAFRAFERFLDLERWRDNALSSPAVAAWLALSRRTVPTADVIARFRDRSSEVQLWTAWAHHALDRVVALTRVIARRAALAITRSSRKAARSAITSYVRYAQLLVEDIQSVWATPGQRVDAVDQLAIAADLAEAFDDVFARAEVALTAGEPSVAANVVDALRATLEALFAGALDRAAASLVFDPRAPDYVTAQRWEQLAAPLTRLTEPSRLRHFPGLTARLFTFCAGTLDGVKIPDEAARLGFVEVADEPKRKFAHFDLPLHKRWSATALQLLAAVRTACGAHETHRELAGRAWTLYKQEKYGGRLPKRADKALANYLDDCLLLPPSLRGPEKGALIDEAVALLRVDQLDPIAERVARLGWMMDVLAAGGDALVTHTKYLLKYGDVAAPKVREALENATFDREPTTRIQAHLALLERSNEDLRELAASLAFMAQRTRNEAGLHRPALYQWVHDRIGAIVARSLERSALAEIDGLCGALERMLRDDVSKRDTVAKNVFRSIARVILTTALTFDGSRPELAARRRWIVCAVQLDWIVVRALDGERGTEAFVWPLQGCTMPRERTVPEAWLAEVRPHLAMHYRAGEGRADRLRIDAYTRKFVREDGGGARFEVTQAVELLVESLREVEGGSATDTLAEATAFPASDDGASTLLRRAQALFAFAKTQWTEVRRLVRFLSAMVDALDGPAVDAAHFQQTRTLFESIRANYPAGSLWFEVPLLAQACEQLLSAAIRLDDAEAARALHPAWAELRRERRRTPIANALSVAQLQLLAVELPDLAGAAKESAGAAARRCVAARVLLEQTPSAAYVVAHDLVAVRDDLLLGYVRKTTGELQGVFAPRGDRRALSEAEAQARAAIAVPSSVWPKLNSATMLAYTRDALDEAMAPARSPHVRSAAIGQFIQSPASSHFEIIALLDTLTALPPPGTEAADDARALLLETVILSVFRTDAAWFVLAYLLGPQMISASPRTTASILANLHAWAPIDKAVGVLGVLLEPDRRGALPAFLHKSILRLLFETSHPEARRTFAREWSAPMHPDVRHEMVKLAVAALAEDDPEKVALAWSILEDVARRPAELGATTVFLLFLPVFRPRQAYPVHRTVDELLRIAVPHSGVPGSFGWVHAKWLAEAEVSFGSPAVRDRLAGLLSTLAAGADPYLRTVALCKVFALSPCVAGVEDDASLDRLQALLSSASTGWASGRAAAFPAPGRDEHAAAVALSPEDDYLLLVAPKLLGALGVRILSAKLATYTEHERRTGRAIEDVCDRHPVAARLRRVFGGVLEALARVPPIEAEKRLRLARVAGGLSSATRESDFAKVLFARYFRDALAFLREDQERLRLML